MEAKKVIEHVQGINGGQTATGTLTLTDFHMIFSAVIPSPTQDGQEPAQPQKKRERWITYPMLSHCTFRPTPPASRQAPSIRIQCRDFTYITFNFTTTEIAREAYDHIKCRTCKLGTVQNLFAFSHKPPKMEREVDGWNIYDPRAEFRRQGISEKLPDKGWRITTINQDYSFCDTYPAFLVVPSKISDNVLKYAKEYRSRNRIPALTYIHPINNCTITRSSQPLAGITRRTNVQDEKLVAASFSALTANGSGGSEDPSPMASQTDMFESSVMLETQLSDKERYEDELISKSMAIYDDKTGKRLIYGAQQNNLIVDARPTINAIMNQAQGMGSEPMDKYKFAEKIFLNIDNIHIMRSSLLKLVDALKDADISPLPPNRDILQQSNWLKHIHDVLDGSGLIARQVGIKHSHVLIHCSDGWDRTSQLSGLSQIMLDPYYRTIDGFIVLVEKDWLSFGYMFRLRAGHLNSEDWFNIQKDAFAGLKVQPWEDDGRSDAFQNVISGAKRLFSSNKDDADLATMGETASGQVVDEEATVQRMISPVFHQFLDCMYQLLRQHKTRFEFNERFLRRLLYHYHSCQYGTFLYNSEKQRKDAGVAEKTASVWDYFLCRRAEFTNPDYDPTVDDHIKGKERIILPRLNEIRWWHQLFGRTEDEMNGALNAAAIAESDRQAAVSTMNYPSVVQAEQVPERPVSRPVSRPASRSTSSAPSPKPPSLSASQSVISSPETVHGILTPEDRQAALQHSVSADGMSAFAALRDGIAGLNISRAVMSNFGRAAEPVPEHSAAASISREQEMREMT